MVLKKALDENFNLATQWSLQVLVEVSDFVQHHVVLSLTAGGFYMWH